MRQPGAIVLISTYELGHQPLGLASPGALLRQAGFAPSLLDVSVTELDLAEVATARLVCVSVPMHTALRLGVLVAERVRAVNPAATICFYGLYASLNAGYLLRTCADAVIGGEYEAALVALAEAMELGAPASVPGVRTRDTSAPPVLSRIPFAIPDRRDLPAITRYAQLVHGHKAIPAGYVEATRGCLHTCAHCPITPVYHGRFFVVPREVVLADIRAQEAAGARHITFGDPDFLNGPGHSLAILRSMHAEFPDLTFDATIKIEHILERRTLFTELRHLGCAFVVSAVESLSDDVLQHLAKGHRREDVVAALRILTDAGIPMRPTFVAFTPWTTARDFEDTLTFVVEHDLIESVAPVQFTIRLLIPPGSALLDNADTMEWLGELDERNFTYRWSHPDSRLDALQSELARIVEAATSAGQTNQAIFAAIRERTEEMLGFSMEPDLVGASPIRPRTSRPIPHLTEDWFC
jgi:radical SAM superfamily enzyme YgiQ (UPF0313 family)